MTLILTLDPCSNILTKFTSSQTKKQVFKLWFVTRYHGTYIIENAGGYRVDFYLQKHRTHKTMFRLLSEIGLLCTLDKRHLNNCHGSFTEALSLVLAFIV